MEEISWLTVETEKTQNSESDIGVRYTKQKQK